MTRLPRKPLPDAPAHSELQDEMAALIKVLATRREQVKEWRRCRLNLTITQADRLNWFITRDEQTLRDLEAKAAKRDAATPNKANARKQKPGTSRASPMGTHRAAQPHHG